MEKPVLNVPPDQSRDELRMPGAGVGAGIGLVVLSQDDGLIATLESVVTSDHAIAICSTEHELAEQIVAGRCGVALVDAATISGSLAELTRRLRLQFPDLVLVVAGGANDQGLLAAQIASGDVYRFLHKPVSAQRVRLFVEAALRRHDEEHAVQSAATAAPPRTARPGGRARDPGFRRWLLPAGLAVAAVAVAGLLLAGRDEPSSEAAATRAPASADSAAVAESLRQADAAFERGELLAPAGRSAADLYRAILARQPDNARAQAGLDRVVNGVLTAAEQSILAGQLDAATRNVDAARALQPANVRIEFLQAQIGKERERLLLARARAAAANGDVGAALAALDGAARDGSADPSVNEARRALQRQQVDDRLRELLNDAAERLQRGALLEPASDNARFFLESARTLAPRDARLARLSQQLRARLLGEAQRSAARGDSAGTERWLRAASDAGAEPAELTAVRTQLATTQNTSRSSEASRLAGLVTQRIGEGRLLEPAEDSARRWFNDLQRLDAGGSATLGARQSLLRAVMSEGRAAVTRGDTTAAARLLAEAETLGASTTELGALSSEITALRERQRAESSVVGASSLKRTRYVEPDYPRDARQAGVSGWVDMEFIVRQDGSVDGVKVLGAQPTGIFDKAAIAALSRWRFEPVRRDGNAVDQRARLRMRFALE